VDTDWSLIDESVDSLLNELRPDNGQLVQTRFNVVLATADQFDPKEVELFVREFARRSLWNVRVTLFVGAADRCWPWRTSEHSFQDFMSRMAELKTCAEIPGISWCGTLLLGMGNRCGVLPREANCSLLARAAELSMASDLIDWLDQALSVSTCIDELFNEDRPRVAVMGMSSVAIPHVSWRKSIVLSYAEQLAQRYRNGHERNGCFDIQFGAAQRSLGQDARGALAQRLRGLARSFLHSSGQSLQHQCGELVRNIGRQSELIDEWDTALRDRMRSITAHFTEQIDEMGNEMALGGGIDSCREILSRQRVQLTILREECMVRRNTSRTQVRVAEAELDERLSAGNPPTAHMFSRFYPIGWMRLWLWRWGTQASAQRLLDREAECAVLDSIISTTDDLTMQLDESLERLNALSRTVKGAERRIRDLLDELLKPRLPTDMVTTSPELLSERVREMLGPIRVQQSLATLVARHESKPWWGWNAEDCYETLVRLSDEILRTKTPLASGLEWQPFDLGADVTHFARITDLSTPALPRYSSDEDESLVQRAWFVPQHTPRRSLPVPPQDAISTTQLPWITVASIVRPTATKN